MKNRSKFKDIQRFREISELLEISFEQAEALFWQVNKRSIDDMYLDFMEEAKREEPGFEFSINPSTLRDTR